MTTTFPKLSNIGLRAINGSEKTVQKSQKSQRNGSMSKRQKFKCTRNFAEKNLQFGLLMIHF